MWGDLALVATAVAFGVGSSLLPMLLNAEAYVVLLGTLTSSEVFLFWLVVALSVGTMLGKVVVFDLVRKGRQKLTRKERKPSSRRVVMAARRVNDVLLGLLDHRHLGGATVFASSAFMMPPLAVVTVLAGASRQPMWLFALMVFVGRTLQYLAIAFLLHHVF
ncbi:MAG: hypothetical protein QM621_13710 [Aeromicrobium sp.]|uniref:VTT domain-containing protein n=1 Tax=Aeromicrobium sp. TaxID=1871063 RepID=UPI0039E30C3A